MRQSLIAFAALAVLTACTPPVASVWKTVPQSQVPYDKAWPIVVNAVSQHFDIETIDAQSGYLRTSWKVTDTNAFAFGAPFKRARCHVRVESREPFTVKVKVEQQQDDGGSWIEQGNDAKREGEILQELDGRLRTVK